MVCDCWVRYEARRLRIILIFFLRVPLRYCSVACLCLCGWLCFVCPWLVWGLFLLARVRGLRLLGEIKSCSTAERLFFFSWGAASLPLRVRVCACVNGCVLCVHGLCRVQLI